MVKEPLEAIKRDLAVDFLGDVQSASNRLVVSRVQTERPAVRGQVLDYRFKFRFHHGLHVRTHLQKALEIGSRKDNHFARAVHPVEAVPLAWLRNRGPDLKAAELSIGTLVNQVGCESDGKIAAARELLDNRIVLGIILEAATCVNDTRETKSI